MEIIGFLILYFIYLWEQARKDDRLSAANENVREVMAQAREIRRSVDVLETQRKSEQDRQLREQYKC